MFTKSCNKPKSQLRSQYVTPSHPRRIRLTFPILQFSMVYFLEAAATMELVKLVAPGPGHAPAEQTTILVKWHIPKNGFIPMRMAQPSGLDGYPAGKHQPTNGTAPALTKLNGKNDTRANYRGDKTRFRNGNSDIPKEANTSLWITGLPADITSGELFDHLGGRGRSFWVLSTSPTRLGNRIPLQRPSHSLRLPPHSASTDPAGSAPVLPSVATG